MNAADLIRARAGDAPVRLGLILGSGLGHLAGAVEGVTIPYADLPGFPHVAVSGHNPNLVVGDLEGVRVAVFGAREHYYENGNPAAMRPALECLRELGADHLIATNAAGSLRPDIRPGDLMLLSDHINFSGLNPLIGEKTDARFVPMTTAHDLVLREALRESAEAVGVALPQGVYAWYSGPSFRDACRDPGDQDSGRRCRGHVDGARGHSGAVSGAAGGGDFDDHQHGGGHVGRTDQPRAYQGDGTLGGGQAGAGAAALPARYRLRRRTGGFVPV